MNSFQEIWASLEGDLRRDTTATLVKRVIKDGADSILLLAEINEHRGSVSRGIAFGYLRNPEKIRKSLPSLQQLKIYVRQLSDKKTYLTIFLDNPLFQEVFSAFAEDLMQFVSERDPKVDIGTATTQRLKTWKHFFENCAPEGLSLQAQRGLLGELLTLKTYLLPYMPGLEAIQAWQGPDRKAKDFIVNDGGVEVKTTISKKHKKIHISNETQLDSGGFSYLYLVHFGFDETARSKITLVATVAAVRRALEAEVAASVLFEQKLRNYGYLDIHAEKYTSPYIVKESDFYEVGDNFPRLTGNDLPDGVGDVSYSIIISDCGRFRKKESEVLKKLRLKK